MTAEDRDIQHKLKVLKHAEETGHVGRTCRLPFVAIPRGSSLPT